MAPRDDRRDDSAAFTASTPDGEIKNLQILSRLSARHHTWTAVGVTQLGVCCLVIICGNHTVVLLDHMGSTCRQRAGPETDGALMYPSTRELRTNAEPAAMYMSAECTMFAAKPV